MRKLIIAFLMIFLPIMKVEAQTSKIIFYRGPKFINSALKPNLYLSDSVVARMKSKTFKIIEIPSKTVEFYSYLKPHFLMRSNQMTKLKLHLVPNAVYFVKYSLEGINDQIKPKFELVNREQLKELAKSSDLYKKLKENNVKIDDININYSDTIIYRNKRVKLVYDPSLWVSYNIPENMKWDNYFVSYNNLSVAYSLVSNSKILDKNIEEEVKAQIDNYVVKSLSYKRDTINDMPIIAVDVEAEYAGSNFHIKELIYTSEESTFCLLINSKKNDYESNKYLIDKLFTGILKY